MAAIEEQRMEVDQEDDEEVLTEEINFDAITDVNIDKEKFKKGEGITREVVKKLLEEDRRSHHGENTDQLILILANFNWKEGKTGTSDDIKKFMFTKFKLYKIGSGDKPYSNPRGSYLAHITGDRPEQCRKIQKLHRKIKRKLESDDSKLNISKAHIVASLVLYYGEEDTPQAAAAGGDNV